MESNNALLNAILPEIDYSISNTATTTTTTTTTNSNNNDYYNNTNNVTYSGSIANHFKSFYAHPIVNQTSQGFNGRNNKSNMDNAVAFPFEKHSCGDVHTWSLDRQKPSPHSQQNYRSEQKKNCGGHEEIFPHTHQNCHPPYDKTLQSQQQQYHTQTNSDESEGMFRLCNAPTSQTFVENKFHRHKTHFEDRLTNDKIKGTRDAINASSTLFNNHIIEDSSKKNIQSYVSQRKRHKSIDIKREEDHSKRYRTSYSQKQIELLEKTYQMDRYVSRPQRTKLSNELDLSENTIKVSSCNVS